MLSQIATATCTLLVSGLLLSGCQPDEQAASQPSGKKQIGLAPELLPKLKRLPLPDFSAIKDTQAKKKAFFGFLRPLVAHQNAHIQTIHAYLLKLDGQFTKHGELHNKDQQWLDEAADLFRIDAHTNAEKLDALLHQVQPVPSALVLAQAANESAWGTSRFARQGNNLFGMWCYTPGCGIEPLRRDEDATHEVARYDSVEMGIFRYLVNINANRSYRQLREIRQCLQNTGEPVTGRALAAGLTRYSERGSHYAKELRAMIRINQLEPRKTPWWGNSNPDHPCYPLVQVTINKPDPLLAGETMNSPGNPESASTAIISSVQAAQSPPPAAPNTDG